MMKRIALTLSILLGLLCTSQSQVMMLGPADSLSYITSPADIDSLFYWFEADMVVTDSLGGAIANNEGVGTWADLSGNGYDVTQATNTARPVWKATGGPGSKPCIQFDGTNDFLASAAHWWGSDDITVFIVHKHSNATLDAIERIINRLTATVFQWDINGRASANSYGLWATFWKDSATPTQNFQQLRDGAKQTNWELNVVTSNGSGTYSWYADGSSQSLTTSSSGTGDWTITNASNPLQLGAANTTTTPVQFLQGSISAIIVYTRALTTAERTAIETYLNKKYDLY